MDISSITINCDSNQIYKFMYDIHQINLWSFGIEWDHYNNHDGIIKGISNYDQSIAYLKITTNDKTKKIHYWIGEDIQNLIPRIYIRITPTDNINSNQLSMIAFKTDDMTEERWNKLKELHSLEIKEIKRLIESKKIIIKL